MIKATLRYEYNSNTNSVMSVLLKNNIDIRGHREGIGFDHYITCIFTDTEQLNKILLILNSQYNIATTVHRKRELFDFKSWWEKINK